MSNRIIGEIIPEQNELFSLTVSCTTLYAKFTAKKSRIIKIKNGIKNGDTISKYSKWITDIGETEK